MIYNGYLKAFVDEIKERRSNGESRTVIAKDIIKSLDKQPPDPWWRSRSEFDKIAAISGMISYISRDKTKTRVFNTVHYPDAMLIDDIPDVPTRVRNGLRIEDITTIGELRNADIKNMGRTYNIGAVFLLAYPKSKQPKIDFEECRAILLKKLINGCSRAQFMRLIASLGLTEDSPKYPASR